MSFEKHIRKPKTAAVQSPSSAFLKKAIAHTASAKGLPAESKPAPATTKAQLVISTSLVAKKRPLKDLNSTTKPVPTLQLKTISSAESSLHITSPPASTRNVPLSTRAKPGLSAQVSLNSSSRLTVTASTTTRQPTLRLPSKPVEQSEASNVPEVVYPISPAQALKLFAGQLSEYEQGEILDFQQIYYLGGGIGKKPPVSAALLNNGFDDDRGDYKLVTSDHLLYRYEILGILGKGSFGQVCKCFDHKHKETIALKIIRNKRRFHQQGAVEIKVLDLLRTHDRDDRMCVVKMRSYFLFRKHLCLTFELLSLNLYDFLKNNEFRGLSLSLIRRFAIQLIISLKYCKSQGIIHCDLKPENILLKQSNKSGIKVIDFGSACLESERVYTYIQSRFYRAPEVILGIPYTPCIDMWSLGCILAELYLGTPLFPGESEHEQILCIMEMMGLPPANILAASTRKKLFFDSTDAPRVVANSRGKKRFPETKSLSSVLRGADPSFIDFVRGCLAWDTAIRLNPDEALSHAWIQEGLSKMQQVKVSRASETSQKSPKAVGERKVSYSMYGSG